MSLYLLLLHSSYPIYARPENCPNPIQKQIFLDNRWVIPYNPYLLTKYNCHINVEICNTFASVKYLHKYVYKGKKSNSILIDVYNIITIHTLIGHDKVNYSLTNEKIAGKQLDEIMKFLDARYVSASEACWRIFGFDMHGQYPNTVRLPVHLQNKQHIIYKQGDDIKNILEKNSKTPLTEYFELNKKDSDAAKLFYQDIPKYYTWNNNTKTWKKRKRFKILI